MVPGTRRHARRALSAALFATAAASPPWPAAAQVTRPQVETPVPPPAAQAPSVAEVVAQPEAAADCALRSPAYAAVTPTIRAIRFEGPDTAPVPPPILAALAGIAAPPGPQPIAVVCDVRDAAAGALARAGWIASVQIPAQEIADGTLRLVVVTARIKAINIHGELGRFRRLLEQRAAAIQRLDPVNVEEVKRLLLLTSDVPGLRVQLALRSANAAPGEVIGDLQVEAQPALLIANVQNTGSRQLGPLLLSARGELYGLTGHADRSFLAFSNSGDFDETHIVQAGHEIGLGDRGFRVGVRGSYALSRPSIPNLDLRTRSTIAGLDLSAPLLRGTTYRVQAAGGLELLEQRTRIYQSGSSAPFVRDRLRIAFARLDASVGVPDANGEDRLRTRGYVALRKGVDILGATPRGPGAGGYQPSRFDGDPQALVVQGEIAQTARLGIVSLGIEAFGQWANHPLLNFEEFSLGNLTYGRGYDPGANGGDRVVAVRIEPRLRLPEVVRWLDAELYGFYDHVTLWNEDAGTLETDRRFRSVGGGVRLAIAGRALLDLTYAKPLDKALTTDTRKPRDRLLVSVTARLYPWGAVR